LWWRWNQALGAPYIDKRLHGLDLFVGDQIEQFTNIDEVNEARVQLLVSAHMPEGIQPMTVVNMGIAAHHLAVDALDIALKRIGKPRGFSKPFAARELREWRIEGGGTEWLGLL
jgi:hypothetical protein